MIRDLSMRLREEGKIVFSVHVRPSSPRSRVKGRLADGTLKVDIAAVPEHGKANRELVRFLARELGVSHDHVTIIKGGTSPKKTILITPR